MHEPKVSTPKTKKTIFSSEKREKIRKSYKLWKVNRFGNSKKLALTFTWGKKETATTTKRPNLSLSISISISLPIPSSLSLSCLKWTNLLFLSLETPNIYRERRDIWSCRNGCIFIQEATDRGDDTLFYLSATTYLRFDKWTHLSADKSAYITSAVNCGAH